MWFKLDLWKYTKQVTKNLKRNINEWLDIIYDEVIVNSPEDSWEYIDSNKKLQAIQVWNKIKWFVFNSDEKAWEVEYWFRSSPVNWSKKNWKFIITWIGARVYTRSFDNTESQVKKIINKKLLW